MKTLFRSIKHEIDRRVVGQLANAHETGQLSRDCTVCFVAIVNKGEPYLEMQITKKGKKEEEENACNSSDAAGSRSKTT